MTGSVQRVSRLGDRLGLTVHESPLRHQLVAFKSRIAAKYPDSLEDWLLEIANARGATIVARPDLPERMAMLADRTLLADEDLVAGLCLLQGADRPHLLRPAAQMISRGGLDLSRLCRLIVLERLQPVFGPMARAALRVEPDHAGWQLLAARFPENPPRDEPVIHWTRMADPIFAKGKPNAIGWRLAR